MSNTESTISVLVVESSSATQQLLKSIINAHPRLSVVECVTSGENALTFLEKTKPQVVLMNISLPGIDGFTATRRIMETKPLPIVICTETKARGEISNTFDALEAGAVAVVEKPYGMGDSDFAMIASRMLETLEAMAEVKVVKRWARKAASAGVTKLRSQSPEAPASSDCQVIAIGASTGGPPALHTILQKLPKTAPPVLIVQHISAGFLSGLTDWLETTTGVPCKIPDHDEKLVCGTAYFAPDEYHMGISQNHSIVLSDDAPEHGLRPSVNFLFRSIAQNCGQSAIGILLTGMGKDGAEELRRLREIGALSIAQDPESCIVAGMPGEAIRRQAACKILSPEEIGSYLANRFGGAIPKHLSESS